VRVEAPKQAVVLGLAQPGGSEIGFHPDKKIQAPGYAFEMMQHEVTYEEVGDGAAVKDDKGEWRMPAWVPKEADKRAKLPVTGISWKQAHEYCRSVEASLPTEEEWEWAARGAQLRAHPWGDGLLDLGRARAFKRQGVMPVDPVMSNEQDVTPGNETTALYDLAGNAQEWTKDVYREDSASGDESWTQEGGITFRAVRGLPIDQPPPKPLPKSSAAFRGALCSSGPCPADAAAMLELVGFRCVRRAK
jgi:formylglycine-generating enzyme required for sulfatase activity